MEESLFDNRFNEIQSECESIKSDSSKLDKEVERLINKINKHIHQLESEIEFMKFAGNYEEQIINLLKPNSHQ